MRPEKSVLLLAAPGVMPEPPADDDTVDFVVDAVALDELCEIRIRTERK
jgi:hypothetical protein